ncbi:MAG: PBP1A family penicillin-binding protein [Magnetococcales bacterium]|nr:PBP1A family penicillin-binding protein [Magnetococcales bacterium]
MSSKHHHDERHGSGRQEPAFDGTPTANPPSTPRSGESHDGAISGDTPPPPPVKRKRRVFLKLFLTLFLLGSLAGGVYAWAVYMRYARDLPTLNTLADYRPSLTSRVYARDYQLLGEFYIERRRFVPRADVPPMLVKAFLAIEDAQFYDHPGIYFKGILRAALANFKAGRVVQGASTITQQVAKTFLLTSERKIKRKIKEVILAFRIEERFTKDEILELYLNQIYLGAGAYGVGAASRIYFDRDVTELTLGQMAMLAALPKAPSNYNPWRFPKVAKKRMTLVLVRMLELNFITQAQYDAALANPLGLARSRPPLEQVSPHYLEHVRRTIRSEWGARQLYRGGLDIYTTLDPSLQRAAHAAVRAGLKAYDSRHGYRGALNRLETLSEESLKNWMASEKEEDTISPLVKAVVLEILKETPADLPQRPGPKKKKEKKKWLKRDKSVARVLTTEGNERFLDFDAVSWARPRVGKWKRLGKKINKVADVLNVGDIILIQPADAQDPLSWPKLAQLPDAEAALVALDPHTGQILAMVGGYDYRRSEFNRATQSHRQPGSAFKPFVFSAALDNNHSPVSRVDDSPIPMTYKDEDTGAVKMWRAENYGHKFYGPTTLRVALEKSRNLVTIRLTKTLGLDTVIDYANRFGLVIPASRRDLSVALGSVGFTPLQMTSAYGILANGGRLVKPVYVARVQDRFGRTIHRHAGGDCLLCHNDPGEQSQLNTAPAGSKALFGRQMIPSETAYQVTHMLRGVVQRGTGIKAKKLGRHLAGKTGTTNDYRDAWFMGYSPSLVTGVWVGRDDYKTLGYREAGSKAALPIWIDFMREALKDQPHTDFTVPRGIHMEQVDGETGTMVSPATKRAVLEAFKVGQHPEQAETTLIEENLPSVDDGLY